MIINQIFVITVNISSHILNVEPYLICQHSLSQIHVTKKTNMNINTLFIFIIIRSQNRRIICRHSFIYRYITQSVYFASALPTLHTIGFLQRNLFSPFSATEDQDENQYFHHICHYHKILKPSQACKVMLTYRRLPISYLSNPFSKEPIQTVLNRQTHTIKFIHPSHNQSEFIQASNQGRIYGVTGGKFPPIAQNAIPFTYIFSQ
eukprot:TRINITY_DN4643_c0_g1_i5.p1 TRINITY_DN4643_c0_g1~~TRINITY_DN4643_c0_g1_i5.p1  ORF type:complete len:205 (+),score=-21.47 TRINITY_DN4643_c0_g1_i5:425-1039(+)